ncbi:hypothetical protein EDB19DRAFT_1831162 [Suillus lakei]|nr:hypothetical protein EDB19DRAFT_1831162 [Suillus lakei]
MQTYQRKTACTATVDRYGCHTGGATDRDQHVRCTAGPYTVQDVFHTAVNGTFTAFTVGKGAGLSATSCPEPPCPATTATTTTTTTAICLTACCMHFTLIEAIFSTVLGRGHHTKNTARLTESITAELASEGSPNVPATKSKPRRTKKSKTTQNHFEGLTVEGDLDDEGSDYTHPSSLPSDTTSDSDCESDVIEITNKELAHLLPSKTVPEQSNRRNKHKRLTKKSTTRASASRRATTTMTMQESPVDLEDAVPL